MFQHKLASSLFMLLLVLSIPGCSSPGLASPDGGKIPLVIFAAGSLILPFQQLESAFEAKYPTIDIQAEFHGSIQVIRHVTELNEAIDLVATADASLIPMLMYAMHDPDTGMPFADWYIQFAGNRLAVAYQPDSLYASEIDATNWFSILSRPDLKVGIPDPRFDAAGYRALMAFALAQQVYQDPFIFNEMFGGDFTYPLGLISESGLSTVTVPEIVETTPDSQVLIRGGSIALIALLESGDLDYAFEYESVIRQHGLRMVSLPDELNLGSWEYSDLYAGVQIRLDFQRFASVEPVFRGEPIGYGITIPGNAPHEEAAILFISFLLGPEGREIMDSVYHPLLDLPVCDNYTNIPIELQSLCISAENP